MDLNSSLTGGGIVASVITVAMVIYKAVNHHRVRSVCCGRVIEVSVDVEETSPRTPKPVRLQEPPPPVVAPPNQPSS